MSFKVISDKNNKNMETREVRLLDQNNNWPVVCDIVISQHDGKHTIILYPLGKDPVRFNKESIDIVLEVDKIVKELPEISAS